MGQLIAKLMGIFGNQEHKVIIVGLDNAGKTTILYQFNVEEIVLRKTHFLMWDIGGQEALRSTWSTYYSNTEALRDASVLIFANKQDVKDSMTTVEISQFLTLSAIRDHPWHIQGCCALTGEGLVAARPGSGPPMDKWSPESLSCLGPVRLWLMVGDWAKSDGKGLNC
ncbi:putative ADP-ribosylation factor-like protein 5C isoform X6 [Marmota marmota marmota]|uniref:putative ADP-ribosylation factor-like protein 5C isoform X6 n=1 Tax=Marmota marmota marmota TaxID=9994 RepID=UPI00209287D5|nr:putative ADP-ribosylation factor-like protein 5C isoform X6 [Marmota marmota marmota]